MRSAVSLPRRTWIVLALVGAALLASLVLYVHGPNDHGDLSLYDRYAWSFWTGHPPFRSLPAEYPLLALLPFTLTILPPLPDFVSVFAVWMLGLLLVGLLVIARRESPRVAEVCAVYLGLGAWGTVLGRYDLVPAAVTLAAWWAVRGRRFPPAYVLLAAGVLLKLYPALLLPVVAIEQHRALAGGTSGRWRPVLAGVALFGAVVGAGFLLAFLLQPSGWLGPFSYSARRPLQIESLPATLLWASGLAGFPVAPNRSFHSYNLVGPLGGPLGAAAQAATVLGLLWTYWRQATGRLGFGRAFVVCLLVVICTGRVFSPQYLIWVLPFIALVERDYDPLWLLVCALTTIVFPFAYRLVPPAGSGPPPGFPALLLGLIALRNTILVAAAVRFLRRPRPGDDPEPRLAGGSSLA